MRPKVSVIIPTYNRKGLLPKTIQSVFAQSFTDYEIIVIDDGSIDSTHESIVDLIEAEKIRYAYQTNKGESAARNHGMALASGEYLLFLDSDDLLLPHTLEKQVACLDSEPNVGLVHGAYTKFSDDVPDLGLRETSSYSGQMYPRILLEWDILMAVPTVMVRASLMTKVGGFDESMRQAADLDMWRRLSRHTSFNALPDVLARIRVHEGNISADKTRAGAVFQKYVDKAFSEDPTLGFVFKRRVLASMLANVGNTMVGECRADSVMSARDYLLRSLKAWPFQTRAILGLAGSFLSHRLRCRIASYWRSAKYRRGAA